MAKMLRQIDDEAIEKPFNKSQFIRLMRYMMVYKKYMIASIGLMVIATICSVGQPYLQSRAIGYLQDRALSGIPLMVLGMIVLGAIGALCTRQRVRWMDACGRKALKTLRQDLFDHIQTR